MKLYDNVILSTLELLEQSNKKSFPVEKASWPEVLDQHMILRSEMAYELGGEGLPAVGCTLITTEKELIKESGISLIGTDLNEIKKDVPYARISIVRVKEGTQEQGEALYNVIRGLEHTRYRFYPEGFMLRVSNSKNKEQVRIGKDAIKDGLNFGITGNMMIDAFKKNPIVEEVQMYYITDPTFGFEKLTKLARQAEDITKTIDHIMRQSLMDCKACSLQEVCNEVEGLKELHFSK